MTTEIDRVSTPPAPAPTRLGQATAVEQSRAVAEVQAAIIVAQQCPRNIQDAIAQMEQSCTQMALAERAFYRYSRGGAAVSGPTVHLARELARCFQNVQYGLAELRRDDEHGESEMQVYAWDVQTNTRSAQVFIVPHKRDKRGGPERLVDLRDIYENNSNNGARRLRQAIFSILPPWFVERAKDLCSRTLAEGGGKPLPQRIADAIKVFEAKGVTVDQLEQKLDRATSRWTEHDVAQLVVVYRSIDRGEVTIDEEFPPQRVTAAEITGPPPAAGPAPSDAAPQQREEWPAVAQPGGGDDS